VLLTLLVAADTAAAQSIQGTATYRERLAWPPSAVFEAVLEDVSRADVAAEVIARTRIVNPPNAPIRFEISYDRTRILSNRTYVVRARILIDERLAFTTDTSYSVLTGGYGNRVSVMLRRVSGVQPVARAPQGADPLLEPLPATFAGTLPCADCPGIDYQLNMFADRTFFLRMAYRDRDVTVDDIGRWLVSSDGRILLLKGSSEAPLTFAIVNRDTLRMLDIDGQKISSTLNYHLTRLQRVEPLEPVLRVSGMYRYTADAGILTECLTGRRLVVAQERDNAALESAYLAARREAGEEVKVLVEARLVPRPNPDTAAEQPAMVVERFISASPGDTCPLPFATLPFEKTMWTATQLDGRPVPPPAIPSRAAHLVFEAAGRVAGSDGCNRVLGSYQVNGNSIGFGRMASTQMACPDTGETERAFHDALSRARAWRILGDRLELYDGTGTRIAVFLGR
jgi:copper homeostasis protein (lipoprotein)